jgi:hypothetical protein
LKFGVWDLEFGIFSHLWLHEPDAATIARASIEFGLPTATPEELAAAYADVFLLNVPPYGTAFTDERGELNGLAAQDAAALFAAHGYQPPELNEVGAPDHVGLYLGFAAQTPGMVSGKWLEWMPICCLAVEREPGAHLFYKALAAKTREAVLNKLQTPNIKLQNQLSVVSHQPSAITTHHLPLTTHQPELSLHDLMRFFLTPTQCGVFLSRSRLGQMALALGLRLPFGSRWDVAEWLFQSAGEAEQVNGLIREIEIEVSAWTAEYKKWAEAYPAWRPVAEAWLARTSAAQSQCAKMRLAVLAESV